MPRLPHKDCYLMKIMGLLEWEIQLTNDETNIKERSGNSEKDAIPDFIHDISNMVGGSNVANNSNNHSSAKRKGARHTTL